MLRTLVVLSLSLAASTASAAQATKPAATKPAATSTAAPPPAQKPPAATPADPTTPPPAAAKPASPGAPRAKTRVAVMDVASVQGVAAGTATILTNIVVADVARAGLETISKGDIAAILGFERQKQVLGCSQEASCLAEIGGALGVDFLLTGQVGQIGSQFHVALQLVDTKKARVAARASRFTEKTEDALVKGTREATTEVLAAALGAAQLAAAIAASAPAAMPAPSHRSAWIAYGTAAALAVGGVVTGAVARSKYDDLKAKQGTPGYDALYASSSSSIRSTAVAADVMLGGALVAAGVGTWLWFRADGRSVAVVPVIAPDSAALALVSHF